MLYLKSYLDSLYADYSEPLHDLYTTYGGGGGGGDIKLPKLKNFF